MAEKNTRKWKEYVEYESKFAERLTQLRMQRNISSRQMSLDLGQNEGYVNKIENGKILPPMDIFFRICDYLDVKPAEFFAFCAYNESELRFHDTFPRLSEEKQEQIGLMMQDLLNHNEQKR